MQLWSPECPVLKVVCSFSEQTYTVKVYVFDFREAARGKPQVFKVVRQEWLSEAGDADAAIKV